MNFKSFSKGLIFLTILWLYSLSLFAQTTRVRGVVTDASNKQAMPFVTVSFQGSTIGAPTDSYGRFQISTTNSSYTNIKVSFVGYKVVVVPITPGKEQIINVKLVPDQQQLAEVDIKSGKKPKYRNKDNPAVELIRKVIENKDKNRPESYNYVEYRSYDKVQFSLANVSPTIGDKKLFRKYKLNAATFFK